MIELHDLRQYAESFIEKAEQARDSDYTELREKLSRGACLTLNIFLDHLERDLKRADTKGVKKIKCSLFDD